jgi:hypothetical protein
MSVCAKPSCEEEVPPPFPGKTTGRRRLYCDLHSRWRRGPLPPKRCKQPGCPKFVEMRDGKRSKRAFCPDHGVSGDRVYSPSENCAARRVEWREWLIAQKDGPCIDCGGRFHHQAMHFDHRHPDLKDFIVSSASLRPRELVIAEIAKCDLICANCHAVRTWMRRNYTSSTSTHQENPPCPNRRASNTDLAAESAAESSFSSSSAKEPAEAPLHQRTNTPENAPRPPAARTSAARARGTTLFHRGTPGTAPLDGLRRAARR